MEYSRTNTHYWNDMRGILFLFLITGVWGMVNGVKHCDHMGTLLYDDLGCTPLQDDGNPCPSKYHCDSFTPQNKSCIFRGKYYDVNETIEDSLLAENCFFDCRCVDPTGFEKYECGLTNCTEWTQSYNTSNCYKTYDVDDCCSTGIKCPSEDTEIHECVFEGVRYREGELFIPTNSCAKCSCQEGFKGVVEEPFCKRNLCATQVVNFEELENFCAPLYLPSGDDTALCCPHDWVCHSENDRIVRISPNQDPSLDLFCNFGTKVLGYGEGFTRLFNYFGMDIQVTCECLLPPLLTCKKT